MNLNSVAGNNAYAFVQKALNNTPSDATGGASEASGGGFAEMVIGAAKGALDNVRQAEQVSASAMVGKASLTDVVTAVNGADIALKSVVAIRDRVISAYQDIMKMPI